MVNGAATSQLGTDVIGACAQVENADLENSDNGESGEELICPTCRLPIGSGSSICCDRCEIWTHIECEQINPEMYSLLDNSDLGYTCLACTHELQCEDLNESLCADDRNILESNPLADEEETYKKEGYEPETLIASVRETVVSSSITTQVPQTTITNRIGVPMQGESDRRSSMSAEVQVTPSNVHRGRKKGLNVNSGDNNVSNEANTENKTSKLSKKGGGVNSRKQNRRSNLNYRDL